MNSKWSNSSDRNQGVNNKRVDLIHEILNAANVSSFFLLLNVFIYFILISKYFFCYIIRVYFSVFSQGM